MSDSVNGTVAIKSVKGEGTEKRRYGLKVEGDWYNAFGSTDVSEGDEVKIEYSTNDYGNQIENIEVVGSGSNQGSGEGEVSDMDAQRTGQGADHSSNFISPEMQVALKEAAETARSVDGLRVQDPEGGGEHVQLVSKLAHGYYRVLQNLADENNGGGK